MLPPSPANDQLNLLHCRIWMLWKVYLNSGSKRVINDFDNGAVMRTVVDYLADCAFRNRKRLVRFVVQPGGMFLRRRTGFCRLPFRFPGLLWFRKTVASSGDPLYTWFRSRRNRLWWGGKRNLIAQSTSRNCRGGHCFWSRPGGCDVQRSGRCTVDSFRALAVGLASAAGMAAILHRPSIAKGKHPRPAGL